jgi:methylsterol monooxygenase
VNQIVVGFPFTFISAYCLKFRGSSSARKLPQFEEVVFELIVVILVEEVAFYYSHRSVRDVHVFATAERES